MSFFATYPALSGGGGGGGGITSINGDTTAAQFIASGTGISVNSVANTHTINSTVTYGNLTDVGTDGITITGGTGAVVGAGTSISQHVADSTHNGYLSSTDWSTFNAKQAALTIGNLTDVGTDGITITGGTGAVIGSGTSISQQVADSTHNGYLSSTDWTTFNSKQAALTIGNLTDVGTDGITITGGTGSVIGSGTSISQQVANGSQNGYLSSTDWTTFNSKQPAGSYVTSLTGDVTGTGPGATATSLVATTNATITTLSALTTANALTSASSLATVGTITTGVWNGTTIAIANGGTGQTSASAAFNALSPLTTKGDIVVYSTTNTRQPVGANGEVLVADSTQATGIKWAPVGGETAPTVFTPNWLGGTVGATVLATYTRSNQYMLIQLTQELTGSASVTAFELEIPTGLTVDSTYMSILTAAAQMSGQGNWYLVGGGSYDPLLINFGGSTTSFVFMRLNGASLKDNNVSPGDHISFNARIPILEWA